jgi:CRISPR-associated protein Csm4
MEQYWFGRSGKDSQARPSFFTGPMELYCVVDNTRPAALSMEELHQILADIGMMGFGRDASIGLGRFTIESFEEQPLPSQAHPNAYLTLAPCAPQGETWRADHCFYHLFTRFGRHGDIGVHAGHPFKTPLLLATTGSVFTPQTFAPRPFIGHGLGGDGSLSKSLPATVHQGYAPVVAIMLDHATDPVHM